MEPSNMGGNPPDSMLSKPLLKLKMLDALRKGNYSDLKQLIDTQFVPKNDPNVIQVARLILHYSIQVAPFQLVKEIILKNVDLDSDDQSESLGLRIDLNEQDNKGNTPLHLSAYQSRSDLVSFLMDQPSINDCVTNDMNLQPYELCRNVNVAQLMQYKRSQYIADIATEFRTAFNNRDFQHLESILNNQRNFQLLDINGMDPQTGDTVLHEFVKKRDVIMCRWLLEHGADPFKRDSKGRLPVDIVKNATSNNDTANPSSSNDSNGTSTTQLAIDMELKKMLDKSATEQSVIDIDTTSSNTEKIINNRLSAPPTFQGYLRKWTNFAQGYKLRYFILSSDGKLSYYIDQDDTQNVCRGSLNVSNCYIHLDSSEKLKFEIIGGGTNETIRWHLKGNHHIETNRWVWAIQGAIRFAKDRNKGLVSQTTIHKFKNDATANGEVNIPKEFANNDHVSLAEELNDTISIKTNRTDAGITSVTSQKTNDDTISKTRVDVFSQDMTSQIKGMDINATEINDVSINIEEDTEKYDDEDDEDDEENNRLYDIIANSGVDIKLTYGPFSQKLHILRRSISIELSSLSELLSDPSLKNNETSQMMNEIIDTVYKSLQTTNVNFEKLNDFTEKRDKRLINILRKQYDVNSVWLQSMKELELELIEKDTKLNNLENDRKQLKKLLETAKETVQNNVAKVEEKIDDKEQNVDSENNETLQQIVEFINHNNEDEVNDDDSDADEFFDAEEVTEPEPEPERITSAQDLVEISTIASDSTSLTITEPTTDKTDVTLNILPLVTKAQGSKLDKIEKDNSFLGYETGYRTKLKVDADNRPTVSLWGVLKSMVGKDLTKIALPVSFNEPSSMLERVTEDLEYASLLTQASTFSDSTLRLLYVAIFTATPYASTINRVAKPFNPLLGETFEYTNKDMEYRFVTEQVSHHPAICATMAESPRWDFYGESNVDSKFNGRSFAIKHLGKWFVNLRPDVESDTSNPESQIQEEIYSYKKPNNSVIGILVGKPEVDNTSPARIDNHTTGDYCILNYKARGWTSAGAFEVRGEVFDKDGNKRWVLGGHWNDAIYAKKHTDSSNPNDNDFSLDNKTKQILKNSGTVGVNDPKYDGSKFLVWKSNKRYQGVPFNLTKFAITLNDDNPKLLEWVAPTDSRLRPDQRAMEEGQYDKAADEKHRLEEKQRAVHKEREKENVKFLPKWFTKDKHPTTLEPYWRFDGDYWKQREIHSWDKCEDIF